MDNLEKEFYLVRAKRMGYSESKAEALWAAQTLEDEKDFRSFQKFQAIKSHSKRTMLRSLISLVIVASVSSPATVWLSIALALDLGELFSKLILDKLRN